MNDVLKKYYQLVLRDKIYLEKYILSEDTHYKMVDIIEKCYIWRKVNSYESLENIVHSEKAMELLGISDYYSDEMCELLAEHLKVDFTKLTDEEINCILSNDNLHGLLENENTPKQLKDCIEIEEESQIICKEMYEYLSKGQGDTKEQTEVDLEEINMGE